MIVLGICKTRLREQDTEAVQALNDGTQAPPLTNSHRGHGGVGVIVHPLIVCHTVDKYSSQTIQSLTVRISSTTILIMYINPRAKRAEEINALEKVNRVSGQKAIIMGDINTRLERWDTINKTGGVRLERCADKTGWNIKGPRNHSCVTNQGNSTPDIFLIKRLHTSNAKTMTEKKPIGSDHLPVQTTLEFHDSTTPLKEADVIRRKLRNNPNVAKSAKDLYYSNLPK